MSWVSILIIVVLIFWILDLRRNLQTFTLYQEDDRARVDRLSEWIDKEKKELISRLENTIDNLSSTTVKLERHILKSEYLDLYRKSKTENEKFDVIIDYWIQRDLEGYPYDPDGCSYKNHFMLYGVKKNYMSVLHAHSWDDEQFGDFEKAFYEIVQDEYKLYFSVGHDTWEDDLSAYIESEIKR